MNFNSIEKTHTPDDADIWFKNREKPIADYTPPEFEEPELIESEEHKTVTTTDVRNELNMIKLSEPTAEIVVEVINVLIPVIFVALLKGSDKELMKLDDDEKATLVSAFANYFKDKNIQASPGVVLLGSITSIYGAKIMFAMMLKKEKEKEVDQLKKQNEQLKEQNELIKQVIENQNIKQNEEKGGN
ncbi:hypothetical protein LJC11_03245 [Bacteroidales bacterium OttesenSCG-928-I21]|nr:hypothetical protein [Bacteroidales bacterium OttesenSCG-928-I21]